MISWQPALDLAGEIVPIARHRPERHAVPAARLEDALDDGLDVLPPRLPRVAHGGCEVVGANGHAVEARNPADGLDLVHSRHVLEERVDDRFLVRAPHVLGGRQPEGLGAPARGEAPRALGRVLHRPHRALGVAEGDDVGHHDRGGADVQVAEDHVGRVHRDADGDRHVVEVGGPHHLLALPLADGPVLGIEEDLVGAAPREHLDQAGGVKLEPRGEHGLAGPELDLDPLAAHERLLESRVKGHPRSSLLDKTRGPGGVTRAGGGARAPPRWPLPTHQSRAELPARRRATRRSARSRSVPRIPRGKKSTTSTNRSPRTSSHRSASR